MNQIPQMFNLNLNQVLLMALALAIIISSVHGFAMGLRRQQPDREGAINHSLAVKMTVSIPVAILIGLVAPLWPALAASVVAALVISVWVAPLP
jgi:uncharacterized iron-regulated membrane protein